MLYLPTGINTELIVFTLSVDGVCIAAGKHGFTFWLVYINSEGKVMRINGATFDNFEDLHEFIQALKDLPPALPERAVPSSTSIEKLPDEQPYEAAAQAAYEAWELL